MQAFNRIALALSLMCLGGLAAAAPATAGGPAVRQVYAPTRLVSGQHAHARAILVAKSTANATVNLVSSDPSALSTDPTVVVPAGSDGANFGIQAANVSSAEVVTITASIGSSSQSAQVNVVPASLEALYIYETVLGGNNGNGGVLLNGAAGDGVSVALSSNNAALTVPSSVGVAAGKNSGLFSFQTSVVTSDVLVSVSASYGAVTKSRTVRVKGGKPVTLTTLEAPKDTVGGHDVFVGVALNKEAGAGGVQVALSSSDSSVPLPASVTIAVGHRISVLVVHTNGVSSDTTANLSASYNGITLNASVIVHAAQLEVIGATPRHLASGMPAQLFIELNGKAPAGGDSIILSSDTPGVISVPASVSVDEGKWYVVVPLTAGTVTQQTVVTISATFNGVTKTAAITVTPHK